MRLQQQLRFYLERLGLSGAQLSKRAGVPNATLAEWLRGRQPRNIAHLKKVADTLGTSLDNLLYGTGEGTNEPGDQIARRAVEALMGDGWVGGTFELKIRRVKPR